MRPLVGWLRKKLAGEIGLKSAWLTIRLKLAFYDFFAGSRCVQVGVAQKKIKIIINNNVYCL